MERKLFCEYGALAYWLAVVKCRVARRIKDLFSAETFAAQKTDKLLPVLTAKYRAVLYKDSPLFNAVSEKNKVVNVNIAYPKVSGILIKPGETFSFWKLVGSCTKRKGYKAARILKYGRPTHGTGGGVCQVSNIINYLALHSMLTRTEYHDHDYLDLYPDFGEQIPFGTGTATFYNYKDLRYKNNTELTYQIILHIKDNYLYCELRSDQVQEEQWQIESQFYFSRCEGEVYRIGKVLKHRVDGESGAVSFSEEIKTYRAKLLYDAELVNVREDEKFDA